MANVSITNPTILNSETADVTKLTQNDNDLVNGLTDGTKDISINSPTFAGVQLNAAGTVGVPAISFSSDSDTGLYRIGANNLGAAVGGTKIVDIASTGIAVTGAVASTTLSVSGKVATTTEIDHVICVGYSTGSFTDPPTDTELDTGFPTAQSYALYLILPGFDSTKARLVFFDGTFWQYSAKFTKAV